MLDGLAGLVGFNGLRGLAGLEIFPGLIGSLNQSLRDDLLLEGSQPNITIRNSAKQSFFIVRSFELF